MYVCIYACIYIYIYGEREREGDVVICIINISIIIISIISSSSSNMHGMCIIMFTITIVIYIYIHILSTDRVPSRRVAALKHDAKLPVGFGMLDLTLDGSHLRGVNFLGQTSERNLVVDCFPLLIASSFDRSWAFRSPVQQEE